MTTAVPAAAWDTGRAGYGDGAIWCESLTGDDEVFGCVGGV